MWSGIFSFRPNWFDNLLNDENSRNIEIQSNVKQQNSSKKKFIPESLRVRMLSLFYSWDPLKKIEYYQTSVSIFPEITLNTPCIHFRVIPDDSDEYQSKQTK